MAEVEKHDTATSAWFVHGGKVRRKQVNMDYVLTGLPVTQAGTRSKALTSTYTVLLGL